MSRSGRTFAATGSLRWERVPGVRTVADDLARASMAERFDAIVCVNVLEHIPDEIGALQNARRMLDRIVPALKIIERILPPLFGLSLVAVARPSCIMPGHSVWDI